MRSVSTSLSEGEGARVSGDDGGEDVSEGGGGGDDSGVWRTGVSGSSLGRKAELMSPIPTKKSSAQRAI